MTTMRHDIKLKRLISKYGLEGYGLYNLILESIVEDLSDCSPLPGLQETCEDIAEFYNGNTTKINEMVNFMINQKLFELSDIDGQILCKKIYKYLETSATRSESLRKLIRSYKEHLKKNSHPRLPSQTVSDKSKTCHDKCDRKEETRQDKEETRQEEKNEVIEKIYKLYPSKCPISNRATSKSSRDKEKIKKLLQRTSKEILEETIQCYIQSCKDTATFIKNFSTFLNNIPDLQELKASMKDKKSNAAPLDICPKCGKGSPKDITPACDCGHVFYTYEERFGTAK
jgi:hypothetical protein